MIWTWLAHPFITTLGWVILGTGVVWSGRPMLFTILTLGWIALWSRALDKELGAQNE